MRPSHFHGVFDMDDLSEMSLTSSIVRRALRLREIMALEDEAENFTSVMKNEKASYLTDEDLNQFIDAENQADKRQQFMIDWSDWGDWVDWSKLSL